MEFTGRLVSDAGLRETKGNKKVVSFTLAVNDSYKSKDGELKEFTEYFNCSYWQGAKVADSLLKGGIVTVSGRVYLNEYMGRDGNKHANLAVHVNTLKIISSAKAARPGSTSQPTEAATAGITETVDDLSF